MGKEVINTFDRTSIKQKVLAIAQSGPPTMEEGNIRMIMDEVDALREKGISSENILLFLNRNHERYTMEVLYFTRILNRYFHELQEKIKTGEKTPAEWTEAVASVGTIDVLTLASSVGKDFGDGGNELRPYHVKA